jgi:hypothetical protein
VSTRKQEEREIAGLKVTTIQLPAMRGSRLRVKLAKLIVPVLGAFKGSKLSSVQDVMKMDIADLAPALVAVASQLDDTAHDTLMLELLICTSVVRDDGSGKALKFDLTTKQIIDQAFDGDVDALWKAVAFAIELNLGNVFSASTGNEQQAPALSS